MHNAPAVSFPVGRSRFEGWLLLLGCLLACGLAVIWAQIQGRMDWRVALALMFSLLVGMAAGWRWLRCRSAILHWDGQHWRLESVNILPGRVIVRLDLQAWLLLEFKTESARSDWFWLDRHLYKGQWSALRRALYAPSGRSADAALAVNFQRVDQ